MLILAYQNPASVNGSVAPPPAPGPTVEASETRIAGYNAQLKKLGTPELAGEFQDIFAISAKAIVRRISGLPLLLSVEVPSRANPTL